MNIPRLFAILTFGAASIQPVAAFSGPGHEFIGALAEDLLAARTKSPDKTEAARAAAALAAAQRLLGNLPFASAATIPDDIRDWDPPTGRFHSNPDELVKLKGWPAGLAGMIKAYYAKNLDRASGRDHHNYHFTDIAIAPGADLTYALGKVGTNQYDIVQTLRYCEACLKGPVADDGRGITPAMALVLLIHFTGDLHQPLHVGSEYFRPDGTPVVPTQADLDQHLVFGDMGGNDLDVPPSISPFAYNRSGNLHHAWDFDIPARAFAAWEKSLGAKSQNSVELAALLADPKFEPTLWQPKAKTSGGVAAAPWEAWATEILPLAQQAHDHFRVPFPPVGAAAGKGAPARSFHGTAVLKDSSEDYDGWAAPFAQRQLLLAGWRLAWVIENSLK